jgi:hypothetical protein
MKLSVCPVQSTYASKVKIDIDANLTVIHGQCHDYNMGNDEQYSLVALTTQYVYSFWYFQQ